MLYKNVKIIYFIDYKYPGLSYKDLLNCLSFVGIIINSFWQDVRYIVNDYNTGLGVVLSRAIFILRSVKTLPLIGLSVIYNL